MKVIVPRIRRIIVEKGNRKMGVTIAYTEDLEMGKYTCAFSFLSPEDNHCKRIGREKAIERFVKGETVEVDADLDLEDSTIEDVSICVLCHLISFLPEPSKSQKCTVGKVLHIPSWLETFLYLVGESIQDD